MVQASPSPTAYRVSKLPQNAVTLFDLRPDGPTCAALAKDLELSDLRKLSFKGTLKAEGRADWRLDAQLGATLVQPCAVSLEPVTTRVDVPVTRLFTAEFETPAGEEVEMPDDDTQEPLGAFIDPFVVMTESLILEIPAFPRLEGVELAQTAFAAPGVVPMKDEDARPFAGLAALRAEMKDESD